MRSRFWRLYLPIVALVSVCALVVGLLADHNVETDLERPAVRVAAQLQTQLDNVLAPYAAALHSMVQREPRLLREFDAAQPDLGVVADEFFTMLARNDEHFQIRWIDEHGVETVRLDQEADGEIRRITGPELQDKSARPYVAAGLALAPGDLYVSALDLNVEHDVVAEPQVPTIRLVARVFTRSGTPRGVIVLNVHASGFLDRFRAISQANETFLLNADGFWLSSVRADEQWGFMLGNDETFGLRHPPVWSAMQARGEGSLLDESGFWTWTSPALLPASARGDDSLRWKVVAHIAPSEIWQRRLSIWGIVLAGALSILVVAAWLMWRLSKAIEGRLMAQQAYRREAELLADANQSLERSIAEQQRAQQGLRAAVDKLSASRAETEAARQEAEQASRAKSAFLANTSHEIRTPLNAVIGSAYLLGLTRLDGDQRKHVETIDVASRSLLDLIDDVLDLSKIEAGEMQLDPIPFAPAALLGELRTMFDAVARHKGLSLNILPLPPEIPSTVIGDVRRLRQILANLLSNAIKFTDQGSVTLGLGAVDAAAEDGEVGLRCEVTDTGIGVPVGLQDRLFSPFVQADVSTSRKFGGTGLGLSIVRHLSQMLGGRAGVASEEGKGSTFWVEVRVTRAPAGITGEGVVSPEGPLRVLVAQADAADRQVVAEIGRRFDWSVEVVDGGRALVDRVLQAHETGERLDAVVSDWQMPGLDGLEAVKQIRTRHWDAPTACVVMVPAVDEATFRRQDGAMLADGIIIRPVVPSSLFNAINGAARSRGRGLEYVVRRSRIEGDDCQWLYGVRVLVVDDSPMNLDVCQRILAHEGARVTICRSGDEVLGRLADVGERYDVVLMDIQMPGMDGCEATRRLRQQAGWRSVPVIALTASAIASERERAFAAGMNDFLAKPIDPQSLVRVLRIHVERLRDEPLPVVPRQAESNDDGAAFPEIDGIDRSFAVRQLAGDRVLFLSLLRSFAKEHAHAVERIDGLIEGGDVDSAVAYLHRLQGQAGYLAASALFDQAQSLGVALIDGAKDLTAVKSEFERSLGNFLLAIEPWTRPRADRQAEIDAMVPIGEVLSLVGELRGLLKGFALSAEHCARRIAEILHESTWQVHFEPIVDLVEGLRYDEALTALSTFETELRGGKAVAGHRFRQREHE